MTKKLIAPSWLMERDWPAGSRQAKAKRAWQLRLEGFTGIQIADQLGISKSYVVALMRDPDGSQDKQRKQKYSEPCPKCGQPMDGSNGRSANRPKTCKSCRQNQPYSLEVAAERKARRPYWSDQELVDAVAEADRQGADTVGKYRQWRKLQDPRPPMVEVICSRIGWNEARVRAGLKPHQRFGSYHTVPQETCLTALRLVITLVGRPAKAQEYERYAVLLGLPAPATLRQRFKVGKELPRWYDLLGVAFSDWEIGDSCGEYDGWLEELKTRIAVEAG